MRTQVTPALLAIVFSVSAARVADAQPVKGANWLRLDDNYSSVTSSDPRRVGWNLEMAVDAGATLGWGNNYTTLFNSHQIKTLIRIGHSAKPNATERTALAGSSFACSQINTLMNALDSEANGVTNLTGVGGFILGNEANLAGEWNVDGRGYGRVYNCYLARWNGGTRAAISLLAAGPGACHITNCPSYYTAMFAAMGSTVDGFAIHAYGQTSSDVGTGFRGQIDPMNSSTNTAVRNKPVYITEFNAGASPSQPLPVAPTAAYFNGVLTEVANYNSSHGNQIKAIMYFVDSPDSWNRLASTCAPTVTSSSLVWWQTSLCSNATWRGYWRNAQATTTTPGLAASVSLSGIPNFMMPGQITRFTANANNTGTTTWSGGGASSMFRLGTNGANGFMFSAFPQCGGYTNNAADARVYTCSAVGSGATYSYQVDARAPTSAVTSATFQVKMVQDGVQWFGNAPSKAVSMGKAYCGTALTQCILSARTDILPFYQSNGWNTSCAYRDSIVANWCGIDPSACYALKTGTCAAYNNNCRCSGGIHLGGASIDTNGTFCGYQVCGTNSHIFTCQSNNQWADTGRTCK